MDFRGEELVAFVLAVDGHQPGPQLLEHGDRGRRAVDFAGGAALQADVPLDEQRAVLLPGQGKPVQQGQGVLVQAGEQGGDRGAVRAGAYQLLRGALPQHRVDGVDD